MHGERHEKWSLNGGGLGIQVVTRAGFTVPWYKIS